MLDTGFLILHKGDRRPEAGGMKNIFDLKFVFKNWDLFRI
jgi:hypothetical protein